MLKKYYNLIVSWFSILFNRSYYHIPQEVGKAFLANELKGYFNDMTGKIQWNGSIDKEGIPLIQMHDGSLHYFPTTIIQKALGHHDQYLFTKNPREQDEFSKLCDWLLRTQDDKAGWTVKGVLKSKNHSPEYSAMTQGEAISMLVRAWKLFHKEEYLIAAKKAYQLLILPIEAGGTAYYRDNEIYLEEFPCKEKNTILNGWIFAMFGVYDYYLATAEGDSKEVFYETLNTLRNNIAIYDSGFWSFYDEKKTLSSPFYHALHLNQLEALYSITGDKIIEHYIKKWKRYKKSLIKSNYALILKAYQKIRHPPEVLVIK